MSEFRNPLICKPLRSIKDWHTWRKLWDKTEYVEELFGLLHVAFDMEAYSETHTGRTKFLLQVADGYRALEYEGSRVDGVAKAEAKALAEKAFTVLCDRYFKFRCGGHDRDSQSPLNGLSLGLFEALLWFFHDYNRRRYDRNLPEKSIAHRDAIARRYVLELIRECWAYEYAPWSEGPKLDDEVAAAIIAARPKCVVLLHDLGELHFLYDKNQQIDEPTFEALRKLAFLDWNDRQVYRTAEEAVGTYAGRSLLVLEAKLRNDKRASAIEQAEHKRREADEELAAAQQS